MPHHTPHPTPETTKMVRLLPGWMQMRTDPHSLGWRVVNAMHGLPHEQLRHLIQDLDDSRTLGTLDPLDVRQVWRVDLTEDIPASTVEASGFARVITVDGVMVPIQLVDTPDDFFFAHPTRWTHSPTDTVTPPDPDDWAASGIIGVCYVVGHPAAPSGGYLVNYRVPAISPSSTMLYDLDWQPASGYAYGLARQDFATTGMDELLDVGPEAPSGNLAHDPIDVDNLEILDIANLDVSGVARLVPASEYSLNANEVTFVDPSSLYVAEYNYALFPWAKALTTTDTFHLVQRWNAAPTILTDPNNYVDSVIPHELPLSEGVALRVDPLDLRPSGFATVAFRYVRQIEESWENPSASGISLSVTDPNYVGTEPTAVRLRSGSSSFVLPMEAYGPVVVDGGSIHVSGSNLVATPLFDGTSPWTFEGTEHQYLTDPLFLPTDGTVQVLAIGSGAYAMQSLPRPTDDPIYVLTATVSASGVDTPNFPPSGFQTTDDDDAAFYVATKWYDTEGNYRGLVEVSQSVQKSRVYGLTGWTDTSYQQGNGNTDSETHMAGLDPASPGGNTGTSTSAAFTEEKFPVIRFPDIIGDASGQIPLGAAVSSATLRLRTSDSPINYVGKNFPYRLLQPWTEGGVTFTVYSPGNNWNVAGASGINIDYNDEPDDPVSQPFDTINTNYTYNVASGVQAWADGQRNDGWILRAPGGAQGAYWVHTDDQTTTPETTRPLLSVVYAPSGIPAYETIQRVIRAPLNSHSVAVEVGASGGTVLYKELRFEPYSVFDGDLTSKYDYPYQVEVSYNAKKKYQVQGVQSLSTPSGIAHPYPFDWLYEERPHIVTGVRTPHIRPFTVLPLKDSTDAVVDELLPSGRAEDFDVRVIKDLSAIAYAPEDRIVDEEYLDRRVLFVLERNSQVLSVRDMGGMTLDRYALFSPDVRLGGVNQTVQPSGGHSLSPVAVDEAPFVAFDLHLDNPGDHEHQQFYRDVRGMTYRDGSLYVMTAVTDDDQAYDTRASGIADYSEFKDSILYRLDTWDTDHLHVVPPSSQMFPLFGTITNPTDMTWDRNGDLLIAQSGDILRYTPHSDVGILDRTNQLAFFREVYRTNDNASGVML